MKQELLLALAPLVASPSESLVIFDVDGTLAPIVADPAEARVPAETLDLLRQLELVYAGVGLLTGRSLESLETILDIPDLLPSLHTIGNHGIEYGYQGSVTIDPEILEEMPRISKLRKGLAKAPETRLPGVILEDKAYAFSLHYRNASDPSTPEKIARLADRMAMGYGFRVLDGRKVVELRPYYAGGKGAGIARILEGVTARNGRAPANLLFAGDDITDIDGFDELARLRRESGMHTVAIAVEGGAEQASEVIERADYAIDGPAGMYQVMRLLTATGDASKSATGAATEVDSE